MKSVESFLDKIGYVPRNIQLFKEAFTHSSALCGYSYERIEFLGDAVLQLISSERFFNSMPKAKEGVLSRTRAAHVSERPLSEWAKSVGIGEYIIFGKSELANGGSSKDSILADVVEALIGAIYLDRGIETAKLLTDGIFEYIDKHELVRDYKTELQEVIQATGEHAIVYETIGQEGPPHCPVFTVELKVDDRSISLGKGGSKKYAEQQAAKEALEKELSF